MDITQFPFVLLCLVLFIGKSCQLMRCTENCPDGSSCNPVDGTCVPEPSPVDRPYVWLGKGRRLCDRKPEHCMVFGLEYDVSHPRGDDDDIWCREGYKVRCLSRVAPPLKTTPANHLQVVTYNIFERSFVATLDGQRERSCRIPRVFAEGWPEVDVITLQEVFMEGCFGSPFDVRDRPMTIRDLFAQHGYVYQTKTVDSDRNIAVETGGIFIVSRWPIIEEDQFTFDDIHIPSWDFFADKGVSYAKINKTVDGVSRIYHVMGTHMQAGGGSEGDVIRLKQGTQWADFVASKNISKEEAVIFTGDINTDYHGDDDFDDMMSILGTSVPPLISELNVSSCQINDLQILIGKDHWGSWIDHTLFANNYLNPTNSSSDILWARDERFPVCWCEMCIPIRFAYTYPNSSRCHALKNGKTELIRDLSDHQPVLGRFVFPSEF